MSTTAFPTAPPPSVQVDSGINKSSIVQDYLRHVRRERKEREELFQKLSEYSIPPATLDYLRGCPNESIQIAIRHIELCSRSGRTPDFNELMTL